MTPLRSRSNRGGAILVFVATLLLLPAGVASHPNASAGPGAPALVVTLSTDGSLSVSVTLTVTNGSAIRSAMDGNFTPIISALPLNASQRASVIGQIETAENTPIISSYFGNHDGVVSGGEVTLFEQLIAQQLKLLPSGTFTGSGGVALTLDGHGPTSAVLGGVTFSGAEGPVTSTASIGVSTAFLYQFAYGSGNQNLSFSTAISAPAPLGVPNLGSAAQVEISTPAQTTIGSTSGLGDSTAHNDPWGWGGASVSGTYAAAGNSTVIVDFHPSFPVGDVAIGAGSAVVVAIVALLMLRRRRRIRAREATKAPDASPPDEELVGASGSE